MQRGRLPEDQIITERDNLQESAMDLETDKSEAQTEVIDRLSAIERLSERIENRSGSTMDSNHSIDEDRISSELEVPCQDRDQIVDRRFDFARGTFVQSNGMRINLDRESERLDRIGEETCTCGDEQCTGIACQRIQEKEKPQLKFSVNAILGGNYNRRPNPGNYIIVFLKKLQNLVSIRYS